MLESTPLILFRWEIEADTSDIVAQVAGIYSGEERISYPRRAGEPTDCKQHMGSCGGCSKLCMTGLQSNPLIDSSTASISRRLQGFIRCETDKSIPSSAYAFPALQRTAPDPSMQNSGVFWHIMVSRLPGVAKDGPYAMVHSATADNRIPYHDLHQIAKL